MLEAVLDAKNWITLVGSVKRVNLLLQGVQLLRWIHPEAQNVSSTRVGTHQYQAWSKLGIRHFYLKKNKNQFLFLNYFLFFCLFYLVNCDVRQRNVEGTVNVSEPDNPDIGDDEIANVAL